MTALDPSTAATFQPRRPGPTIVEIGKLFERTPPASIEAEMALLGSMILEPRIIADVISIIRGPEVFYNETHQAIYAGLVHLADKHATADILMLGEKLRDQGKLDAVGGVDYLFKLAEIVPTAVNAKFYAQRVAEKAKLRKLIEAAGQTLHEVYTQGSTAQGENARELIDKAESRVFAIAQQEQTGEAQDMQTLVMEEFKRIEAATGSPTGIMTGFEEIDRMLGGFQPGEMIILAARPSMGKTAIALNLAEQIALGTNTPRTIVPTTGRQRVPCGFFSLEMSKGSLCQRMLSGWSGIDSKRLRLGQLHKAEYQTLLDAAQDLATAPLFIDDTPGLSITALRARARRMVAQHKVRCIFLDYMQLLSSPAQARESRQVEVSAISRGVKELARELSIPIIALSQLNRGAENREGNRPRLSDLRESGSLEQDADVVLLLHREEYYHINDHDWEANNPDKKGLAEVIVAKPRNGPTGVANLAFVSSETRFKNLADAGMSAGGGYGAGVGYGEGASNAGKYPYDAEQVRQSGTLANKIKAVIPGKKDLGPVGNPPPRAPGGRGSFSDSIRPGGPIETHRDGGGPERPMPEAPDTDADEEAPF
ncbi:MAG: replicative DNA helicase [bacterium]